MTDKRAFPGANAAPGRSSTALASVPATANAANVAPAVPETPEKAKARQLVMRASAAHQAGRRDQVKKFLEQAIEADPGNALAQFNLGCIWREAKDIIKAEIHFRNAVKADPEYVDAHHGLGDLLFEAKHLFSAIKCYEKGLKYAPNRLPILVNLMRARIMMRSAKEVEQLSRRILAIEEREADVHSYLAWALYRQKRDLDVAIQHCDRAMELNPSYARALAFKERILTLMGDESGADAAWKQVLELARVGVQNNMKLLHESYLCCDSIQRAGELIQEYLRHHPEDHEAQAALLQVAMHEGDFVEGQKLLDAVLEFLPDNAQLKMGRCLNGFRIGNYAEAMKELEIRWYRSGADKKWALPAPDWNGDPIQDGKLAIYCEQGVGDHVMYAGQMAPARARVRRIAMETGPRTQSLFQRSFPDFEVVTRDQLPPNWDPSEFKAKVAGGDLAVAMGLDFEDLPCREGFLVPDPGLTKKLQDRYRALYPGKILVGISWRSGNRDSAAIRSLELTNWKPIFDVPGVAFISLQYGEVAADLEEVKNELGVDVYWDKSVNAMGNMDPFTAQVAAMDMVVSVDNSTVHYAGALGKPCWVMLPVNSDWRWLTERRSSIWYDSLELFRQRKDYGWDQQVLEIAGRLRDVDAEALAEAMAGMLERCADTMLSHDRKFEGEEFCRMLLELGRRKDVAFHGIGVVATAVGKAEEALPLLARAVELAPDKIAYRADLAVALDAAGEPERAEKLARDTIRRHETNTEALLALGRILTRQARYDEETDYFARVLRKAPDHVESRVQLANLQAIQGDWELAQGNFRKTLDFAPNSAVAHTGAAEAALRLGNYAGGWQHFAWRFGTRPGALPRHLETINPDKRPRSWDGGHMKRARLFLRAERSLVEQLLFAPLLNQALAETRSIHAECDMRLLPLMSANFPKVTFVGAGTTTPDAIERNRTQIVSSLGDLAARYRAENAAFPASPPVLAADAELAQQLRGEYVECLPGRHLVGLSWRGGDTSRKDPASDWLPLWASEDRGIVSVQIQPAESDLAELAAAGCNMIVDPRAAGENILAVCAQLSTLDAVIAVDDLTAILAAALGKPVIKVANLVDPWFWGVEGEQMPWYPNVRVVRRGLGEKLSAAVARAVAILDQQILRGSAKVVSAA